MKKKTLVAASLVLAIVTPIAAPAHAGDAIDTEMMMETAEPTQYQAEYLPYNSFHLLQAGQKKEAKFIATMSGQFMADYRLNRLNKQATETNSNLLDLVIPSEFSFRSGAQDSSIDATIPGRYQSTQLRSDRLSSNSPADRDKASLGIKLPF